MGGGGGGGGGGHRGGGHGGRRWNMCVCMCNLRHDMLNLSLPALDLRYEK